ncbi:MAG: ABC transporter ATP-binding protein [Thermofilaceae archaeon]|nr:ABC transporter ATP-binding protein [Thermofilaceae archaeon]MCX8180248.1 ABC transporter ATP-binding protein [Thermofilaceae archaeon]MDW8004032.1 ABC transporter ATP-binding protein [Thermofilaceae archaeon]
MLAVEVRELVKDFGDFRALRGVSFNVEEGEVFGLVGPNGAGKTTTFRIIVGLLPPTSGDVKVFGMRPGDIKVKKLVTYLPEDAGAYRNITGYEYLDMVARLYSSKGKEMEETLELGLKIAGLGDKINEKMKNYSKGMKRRIQVARALMVKPKLAVLDEPSAGLDVIQAREVRELIKKYSNELGATVLLSSHNMHEVEEICTRVALLHKGVVLKEGVIRELLREYGSRNLEELFISLVRGE